MHIRKARLPVELATVEPVAAAYVRRSIQQYQQSSNRGRPENNAVPDILLPSAEGTKQEEAESPEGPLQQGGTRAPQKCFQGLGVLQPVADANDLRY